MEAEQQNSSFQSIRLTESIILNDNNINQLQFFPQQNLNQHQFQKQSNNHTQSFQQPPRINQFNFQYNQQNQGQYHYPINRQQQPSSQWQDQLQQPIPLNEQHNQHQHQPNQFNQNHQPISQTQKLDQNNQQQIIIGQQRDTLSNAVFKCKYCQYIEIRENVIRHQKRKHAIEFCRDNPDFSQCRICKEAIRFNNYQKFKNHEVKCSNKQHNKQILQVQQNNAYLNTGTFIPTSQYQQQLINTIDNISQQIGINYQFNDQNRLS